MDAHIFLTIFSWLFQLIHASLDAVLRNRKLSPTTERIMEAIQL